MALRPPFCHLSETCIRAERTVEKKRKTLCAGVKVVFLPEARNTVTATTRPALSFSPLALSPSSIVFVIIQISASDHNRNSSLFDPRRDQDIMWKSSHLQINHEPPNFSCPSQRLPPFPLLMSWLSVCSGFETGEQTNCDGSCQMTFSLCSQLHCRQPA